jgi:hypothetical protein
MGKNQPGSNHKEKSKQAKLESMTSLMRTTTLHSSILQEQVRLLAWRSKKQQG